VQISNIFYLLRSTGNKRVQTCVYIYRPEKLTLCLKPPVNDKMTPNADVDTCT
jgi:hypothetical protein